MVSQIEGRFSGSFPGLGEEVRFGITPGIFLGQPATFGKILRLVPCQERFAFRWILDHVEKGERGTLRPQEGQAKEEE